MVREATTVLVLYGVTYVIGALAGIASGNDAALSIFESVAMASNGGITSGIVVPGMSWPLELFYLFEMWAGRLEILVALAILNPRVWVEQYRDVRHRMANRAAR
jgi:trk system potassium uptake protein TrkH